MVAACSGPAEEPHPTPNPTPSVAAETPAPATWLTAADARPEPSELADRDAPTVEARRLRTLALARLGDPSASEALVRALRDPDPAVRDAASLGLGALERDAPEAASEALIRAVATEEDLSLRSRMLFDLGRTGSELSWPVLTASLSDEVVEIRRGACRALGAAALVGASPPEAILQRASSRISDDADPETRWLCAQALSRLETPYEGAVADLARGVRDPDPTVRMFSVRALGRTTTGLLDDLTAAARDSDPWVVTTALRPLATRPGAATQFAAVLTELVARLTERPTEPWRPVVLVALEVAPSDPSVVPAVEAFVASLTSTTPEADLGRLHCAAARVLDLAAGATAHVETCGLGVVGALEQDVARATVLAALPRTPERRLTLETLLLHTDARVRETLAAALTDDADLATLRTLLADADVGVRIAATETLGALLRRDRARQDEATLAALLGGAEPAPAPLLDASLRIELRRALESFAAEDDLEGLVTFSQTVAASGDPELTTSLLPLLAHHNVAVRRAVRSAIEAADLDQATIEALPRARPPHVVEPSELALDAVAVHFETDRGTFDAELWPDVSPTTVSRFVALAEAGFFDGLTFHRVVPGFVIQGGDPRGDGYGGPEWSQRCEDGRTRYERGTLGMALAGRDTGGSQFFVTITPQPHLDGRYTAFGRVTNGMEIVDRTMPGDVIRHVRVERGAGRSDFRVAHLSHN